MADMLFGRVFGSKNEKKLNGATRIDDLNSNEIINDESSPPHYMYDFSCEKYFPFDDKEFNNIEGEDDFCNVVEDENENDNVNVDENNESTDDVCGDGQGVPYLNQLISTLEDAKNLFRAYALNNGFSIKIQSTHKRSKSNEIYARLYVCRFSGKIVGESSDVNNEGRYVKRHRDALPKGD